MTVRTIVRREVILPLVLLTTISIATAAGAARPGAVPPPRDHQSIMAEINSGRARPLDTPASRVRRVTGVWTGCSFVFLTSKTTEYMNDTGDVFSVSSDPDPMPPSECAEQRNPTAGEMTAMRAVVDLRNQAGRPPASSRPPGSERVPEWVPAGAFKGTP